MFNSISSLGSSSSSSSSSSSPINTERNEAIADQKQKAINKFYATIKARDKTNSFAAILTPEIQGIFPILNVNDSLALLAAASRSEKTANIKGIWELLKNKYPFPKDLKTMVQNNTFPETEERHPFWQLSEDVVFKMFGLLVGGQDTVNSVAWWNCVVVPFLKINRYYDKIDGLGNVIDQDNFLSGANQYILKIAIDKATSRQTKMRSVIHILIKDKIAAWVNSNVPSIKDKTSAPKSFLFQSIHHDYYNWVIQQPIQPSPNNLDIFLQFNSKTLADHGLIPNFPPQTPSLAGANFPPQTPSLAEQSSELPKQRQKASGTLPNTLILFADNSNQEDQNASDNSSVANNEKLARHKQLVIANFSKCLKLRKSKDTFSQLATPEIKEIFSILNLEDSLVVLIAACKSQKPDYVNGVWNLLKTKYPINLNEIATATDNFPINCHPFWVLHEDILIRIFSHLTSSQVAISSSEWWRLVISPFLTINQYYAKINETERLFDSNEFLSKVNQVFLKNSILKVISRQDRMGGANNILRADKVAIWVKANVTTDASLAFKQIPENFIFQSVDSHHYDWINKQTIKNPAPYLQSILGVNEIPPIENGLDVNPVAPPPQDLFFNNLGTQILQLNLFSGGFNAAQPVKRKLSQVPSESEAPPAKKLKQGNFSMNAILGDDVGEDVGEDKVNSNSPKR